MIEKLNIDKSYELTFPIILEHRKKINEIIDVVNNILCELNEEENYRLEQKEREE